MISSPGALIATWLTVPSESPDKGKVRHSGELSISSPFGLNVSGIVRQPQQISEPRKLNHKDFPDFYMQMP